MHKRATNEIEMTEFPCRFDFKKSYEILMSFSSGLGVAGAAAAAVVVRGGVQLYHMGSHHISAPPPR